MEEEENNRKIDTKKVDHKKKALRDVQPSSAERLEDKADEYLAGWKRCLADFDNYKKQQTKSFGELQRFANEDLIREIIPILDSFELALKTVPEIEESREWKRGVVYIKGQLEDVLRSRGLTHIPAVGEKLNPEYHEAIETAEGNGDPGTILEELQKGYMLHGKVIRPVRVRVAK